MNSPVFSEVTIETRLLPETVHGIDGFPPRLYLLGSADALQRPLISIVGTRNPSAYGLRMCAHFAGELARRGLGVVSGLAVGIDAEAHRSALRANAVTVAVVAHGLDQIYPPQNRLLARDILEAGGAIVSEFASGTPALKHHFPLRNRILSALGICTLVVEASARSGSLITARAAAEQGRSVLVVPGPCGTPSFEGSHALIRDGATLVANPEDALLEIAHMPLLPRSECGRGAWNDAHVFRAAFDCYGGMASLGELVDYTGRDAGQVLASMRDGEKLGWLERRAPQSWLWLG